MRPLLMCLAAAALLGAAGPSLPVRGLHLTNPGPADLPLLLKFIEQDLPKEGVNTLVLEVNYGFRFSRRPELADAAGLSRDDAAGIAEACRRAGVRLIPQLNCLGHQSWARNTFALLTAHPEFDETPGRYPGNEGIYCRSYCPRHPRLHAVLFDAIDELAEAFGADAFHIGMDEVFLLGEQECERCRGRDKAELFAGEVKALRDHLAGSKRETWMWADRFLDGETTGMGKWEASLNQTAPALRLVPNDLVLCDWHYEKAHPSAAYFALNGFRVVSSPWRKPDVALRQLDLVRALRANSSGPVAARTLGMLQTTWVGTTGFLKAYYGEKDADPRAVEAANTFRALMREIRAAN